MVNKRPWSIEDDETLIKMYEEGELKGTIAIMLNRKISAITTRLKILQIKRPEGKSRQPNSARRRWPICWSNLSFEGDEYINDFVGNH